MSLILDALSRADREQRQDSVGDLSLHPADSGSSDNRWRIVVALLLVLCLLLVVVIWQMAKDRSSPGNSTSEEEQEQTPAVIRETAVRSGPDIDEPGTVVSASQPRTTPRSVEQVDPAVAALYRDQQKENEQVADSDVQPATGPTVTAQADDGSVAPPEAETAIDIEQLVAEAERALAEGDKGETLEAEHPAPFITELSQQDRDAIATIYYTRHDHTPGSMENRVVMNGRELRIGDRVVAGVTLVDILKESAVLEFRGKQFRLRALNSWINL